MTNINDSNEKKKEKNKGIVYLATNLINMATYVLVQILAIENKLYNEKPEEEF